jgi:hypothetical protein
MNKKQWIATAVGSGMLVSMWIMARLTFTAIQIHHYRFRMLTLSFGSLVLVALVVFILKD